MKNETKQLNYKRFFTVSLSLLFALSLSLQGVAAKKAGQQGEHEIKKSLKVDANPTVNITLYDAETTINKSEGNEVQVKVNYIAEGIEDKDLKILDAAIKEHLLSKKGNDVNINIRFYDSYSSFVILGVKKTTIKLKDGNELKLTKFKITTLEITLPKEMELKIDSKYNRVNMNFSINGSLYIKGYDMKYYGKGVSGDLTVDGRYSTFEMTNAGNTKLDFYESEIMLNTVKDMEIKSNYSKFKYLSMDNLNMTGYEDKIQGGIIKGDVTIDCKYTEVNLLTTENVTLTMYEGSLNLPKNNSKILFNGRYVEVELGEINSLKMNKGYENNIDIQSANVITSTAGQYNEFDINKLRTSFELDGYEDEIEIETLSKDFEKIAIEGKYIDAEITIDGKPDYKLHGSIQYPNLKVEKGDYTIVLDDKKSSKLDFNYIKGKNTTKEIYLKGYEIDAVISH